MIRSPFVFKWTPPITSLIISLLCVQASICLAMEPCPDTCLPPECICPSTSAPADLAVSDTPQFVVLYTDEIVTESMFRRIIDMTMKHQNSNGCAIPITWYIRSEHSDPGMIRNAFNRYFEIAVSAAAEGGNIAEQIQKAKSWLVSSASIPESSIIGFRSPQWSNGIASRSVLKDVGFRYDHSIRESSQSPSLRNWPYSMDFGIVQDCNDPDVLCDAREQHPGVIEIPVWEFRDRHNKSVKTTKSSSPADAIFSNPDWAASLVFNFGASFYGNRAPMAIPLSGKYLLEDGANVEALEKFIAQILQFDNVWIVTNSQLISFMESPKDVRHVHELLECGTRSSVGTDCFPPNGGCARGTFDYAACTCICENSDNRLLPGFCVDKYQRCTVETAFETVTQTYFCKPIEQQKEELKIHGLDPGTWLILLYVVLAVLAAFALWRGFLIGRRRARMLQHGL